MCLDKLGASVENGVCKKDYVFLLIALTFKFLSQHFLTQTYSHINLLGWERIKKARQSLSGGWVS